MCDGGPQAERLFSEQNECLETCGAPAVCQMWWWWLIISAARLEQAARLQSKREVYGGRDFQNFLAEVFCCRCFIYPCGNGFLKLFINL